MCTPRWGALCSDPSWAPALPSSPMRTGLCLGLVAETPTCQGQPHASSILCPQEHPRCSKGSPLGAGLQGQPHCRQAEPRTPGSPGSLGSSSSSHSGAERNLRPPGSHDRGPFSGVSTRVCVPAGLILEGDAHLGVPADLCFRTSGSGEREKFTWAGLGVQERRCGRE